MAEAGRGVSNGPNGRPLNATVSGSAPGIPDDPLSPGQTVEDAIGPPDDDLSPKELEARVFGTGEDSGAATDPDEPEAHPS